MHRSAASTRRRPAEVMPGSLSQSLEMLQTVPYKGQRGIVWRGGEKIESNKELCLSWTATQSQGQSDPAPQHTQSVSMCSLRSQCATTLATAAEYTSSMEIPWNVPKHDILSALRCGYNISSGFDCSVRHTFLLLASCQIQRRK